MQKAQQATNNWNPHYEYIWSPTDPNDIGDALRDQTSSYYQGKFQDTIRYLRPPNDVAVTFNEYHSQACQRVCSLKRVNLRTRLGPAWFDKECKEKRIEAIKAGENVNNEEDRAHLAIKCREYRALKQQKKRQHNAACIVLLLHTIETKR